MKTIINTIVTAYRRARLKFTNTLIIDRRTWDRGENSDSQLLGEKTGRMCCLGFYALACGFAPKQILGIGVPSDLVHVDDRPDDGKRTTPRGMEWLTRLTDDAPADYVETELATINDLRRIEDDERERRLTESFNRFGGPRLKFIR